MGRDSASRPPVTGRCPRCGGGFIRSDDGLQCLLCGRDYLHPAHLATAADRDADPDRPQPGRVGWGIRCLHCGVFLHGKDDAERLPNRGRYQCRGGCKPAMAG